MTREELREHLFGSGPCPEWGIVLGSGFDVWLKKLSPGEAVPFQDVDGVCASKVSGHGGYFTSGTIGGKPAAISAGRLHLYEGLTDSQVAEPVNVLRSMGVTSIMLTSAVGSVGRSFRPGDAVVIEDQINLTGEDPHTGAGRFVDASSLYDPLYVGLLYERGLKKGVLAGVRGPSFETPAEARFLEISGADVVCMSTVLEALVLAGTGVKCAGIVVVANKAGNREVTHEAVLDVVRRSAEALWEVVLDVIIHGPV